MTKLELKDPKLVRKAQTTAEYIKTLPDKTNITMYQAVAAVYPEEAPQLTHEDLSGIYDEAVRVLDGTNIVLDMTAHEGKLEGLLFNMDFIVRRKRLQKALITSWTGTNAQQKLSFSVNGRTYLSEKQTDEEKVSRKAIKYIDKDHSEIILCMLADLAEGEQAEGDAWELTVTYLDGTKKTVSGPMRSDLEVDGVNLTEYIRAKVPIENLAVFDKKPELNPKSQNNHAALAHQS